MRIFNERSWRICGGQLNVYDLRTKEGTDRPDAW